MHFECDYGFLDSFVSMGAIAMTGFFILSGFSLQLSYENRDFGDVNECRKFYIKRAIQILPLYFVVHLIYLTPLISVPIDERILLFPFQTLGLQSHFSSLFKFSHNGGTWFISCLIACYFVFPLIHMLIKERKLKFYLVILLVVSSILFLSPLVQQKFRTNSIYDNPFFRFLEFSIGMVMYKIYGICTKKKWFSSIFNGITALLILIVLIWTISKIILSGYPVSYMRYNFFVVPCFMLIIFSVSTIKCKRPIFIRNIVWLSAISYAFFLSQMIGVWKISRIIVSFAGIDTNVIRIIISFIVCLTFSIALHHIIELPVSNFCKKKYLTI